MIRPDLVLTVFSIVHDLSNICLSQADDPPNIGTVHKRHKINPVTNQTKGALSWFAVIASGVAPYQRGRPLHLLCQDKR